MPHATAVESRREPASGCGDSSQEGMLEATCQTFGEESRSTSLASMPDGEALASGTTACVSSRARSSSQSAAGL